MSSAAQLIGNQNCNLRARDYLSGPQIYFMHIQGAATVLFDVLFQLAFPCNTFFIVSTKFPNTSLFLATKPTGRTGTGITITPNGTEEWFPLTAASAGISPPNYWTVIRFTETVNQLYMSIGAEGGTTVWTVACMEDNIVSVSGGPWG